MKTKTGNLSPWLYWTPRVLAILMLLFLAMFSLDVFEEGQGFWGTLFGLFMHNIPVIVLAIVLWIAWKREIITAVAFILVGLFFLSRYIITAIVNGFEWYYLYYSLIIVGPLVVIGILFWINWMRRGKGKKR